MNSSFAKGNLAKKNDDIDASWRVRILGPLKSFLGNMREVSAFTYVPAHVPSWSWPAWKLPSEPSDQKSLSSSQ
jgi:hypothetical protein